MYWFFKPVCVHTLSDRCGAAWRIASPVDRSCFLDNYHPISFFLSLLRSYRIFASLITDNRGKTARKYSPP